MAALRLIDVSDEGLLVRTAASPVHGVVSYVQGSALASLGLPGSRGATSVLVGRFVVNPTASQPASR